jgi:hypothetical protein
MYFIVHMTSMKYWKNVFANSLVRVFWENLKLLRALASLLTSREPLPVSHGSVEKTLCAKVAKAPRHRGPQALFHICSLLNRSGSPHSSQANPQALFTLIHPCQLTGENPFDYLRQLLRHARKGAGSPEQWFP